MMNSFSLLILLFNFVYFDLQPKSSRPMLTPFILLSLYFVVVVKNICIGVNDMT